MAAAALWGVDTARNRIHISPLAECHLCCDERAAALCRLDDERPLGEPADDAVARGEKCRQRLRPRRVLGDHSTARLDDLREQTAVLRWVRNIHAAAEYSDRPAATQRPAMRARIDATRRSAHNGHTRRRKPLGKLHCRSLTIGGEFTCADDPDPPCVRYQCTTIVEDERRIKDLAQHDGIEFVINGDNGHILPRALRFDLRGQIGMLLYVPRECLCQCIGQNARCTQVCGRHPPDLPRLGHSRTQTAHTHTADLAALQQRR